MSPEPMGRDEVLENLAQILFGLQIPVAQRDLGYVLGAAAEPYLQIRRLVSAQTGSAWPTQDDYERFLAASLDRKRVTT